MAELSPAGGWAAGQVRKRWRETNTYSYAYTYTTSTWFK